MNNSAGIYILYGASGCGKTTIVDLLTGDDADELYKYYVSVHSKGTTRLQRFYDGVELTCGLSEEEIRTNYIGDNAVNPTVNFSYGDKGYVYYQYKTAHGQIAYGIQKKQIDDALSQGKRHLIICNNLNIISKIKEDYSSKCAVKVLFLKFTAPLETIKEFIEERRKNGKYITGSSDEEDTSQRVKKISELDEIFNSNSDIFDGVILNKFKSRKELKAAFNYLKKQLNFFMNIPESWESAICSGAFVITSFKDSAQFNNAQFAFRKGASYALDKHGKPIEARRVDQLYLEDGKTAIIDNIYKSIISAEVIIADLTDNRPNCYYELGFARALNKPVILFADKNTTLEFDERGYSYIPYDVSSDEGRADLVASVHNALKKLGYTLKEE